MFEAQLGLTPVEHISIQDAIRHQIYELLAAGDLQPGSPLPSEKELARQINVSRPALREAIRGLAGEGLLEVKRGKGIFVSRPSPGLAVRRQLLDLMFVDDYARDILEARQILEPEVAAMFAAKATDEDLEQLESIIYGAESGELGSEGMWMFHMKIVRVAGNTALLGILQVFYEMLQRSENNDEVPQVVSLHRKLLEALKKRDPEIARSAMADHVSHLYAWLQTNGARGK